MPRLADFLISELTAKHFPDVRCRNGSFKLDGFRTFVASHFSPAKTMVPSAGAIIGLPSLVAISKPL